MYIFKVWGDGMNFNYFKNYVTIVEEGSLIAASRKLKVAQPALSNQIKAMELSYGVRLFYRGARRLELTDAGRILYQRAKSMCAIENAARNEIMDGCSGNSGTLKIGVTSSVDNAYLTALFAEFSDKYPNAKVHLCDAEVPELTNRLHNGEIEAMMIRAISFDPGGMEVLHIEHDELVVVYREGSFFQDIPGNTIGLRALEDVPLSLVEDAERPVSTAFKMNGLRQNLKFVSTRMSRCMEWARMGKAVAIVPYLVVRELGYSDLKIRRFDEPTSPPPNLMIVAQKRKYRSQVVNNFLDLMANLFDFEMVEADDDIETEDLLIEAE